MQIDWITVSAHIVNFLILVWLLKRFLYRPVIRAMDRRIAAVAKEKGIETVVFDRNEHRYHGRVKALADAAREGGLKF